MSSTANPYDIPEIESADALRDEIIRNLSEYGEVLSIDGAITGINDGYLMDNVVAKLKTPMHYEDGWSSVEVNWDSKYGLSYNGSWLKPKTNNPNDRVVRATFEKIKGINQDVMKTIQEAQSQKMRSLWKWKCVTVVLNMLLAALVGLIFAFSERSVPAYEYWSLDHVFFAVIDILIYSFIISIFMKLFYSVCEYFVKSKYDNKIYFWNIEWDHNRQKKFYDLFDSATERGIFVNNLKSACDDIGMKLVGNLGLPKLAYWAESTPVTAVEFTGVTERGYTTNKESSLFFDGTNIYVINNDKYTRCEPANNISLILANA